MRPLLCLLLFGLIASPRLAGCQERVAPERAPSPKAAAVVSRRGAGATIGQPELGVEWVTIPAGRFNMGTAGHRDDEAPVHEVRVPTFQLSATEVTVAQYRSCVEAGACTEPSAATTKPNCNWGRDDHEDHPINCVDWHQALAFARWAGARLPSESEWEYAARAGTTTPFSSGRCLTTEQANFNGKYPVDGCPEGIYRAQTTPVRSFPANPWGLHDMHGNVWEWVMDSWKSYTETPVDGSPRISRSIYVLRVYRGGGWYSVAESCRSAKRGKRDRDYRHYGLGFRLAR